MKGTKHSTSHKNLSKSSSEKGRKSSTSARKKPKRDTKITDADTSQFKKKWCGPQLVRKKIQELRTPDLIIKVSYKGKRISIPVHDPNSHSLNQIVMPHISRFQAEVFRNSTFDPNEIQGWKLQSGDPLRDYYLQMGKPLQVFKGQALEVEPIWKKKLFEKVQLNHFDILKCIGTGGFSRVFLARFKSSGKYYALKLMEKEGLVDTGKECVVSNQRDIMVGLNSPHIVNLEFAFETKHFVALALEYCPGGQLFYYLRKVKRMTQEEARYCFIEILLGLQYLHNQKIIYRDIKPENIMIDMDGNLKIADFGLSKLGMSPQDFAYTYCGSPQYMAPQMLTKSGHNFSVDYYCIGALLYELVTGNPPFYSRDVDKIYHSIQNEQISFPGYVVLSDQIKMLLEGLLAKDPKRRLGSLGGIREILGHPWVRKMKPSDITNKLVTTPIKIDILQFNVNQEEILEGEGQFIEKLEEEDQYFEPIFQDFYFNKHEDINIADQMFPSVKSDSTKENRSLKPKYSNIDRPKNSMEPFRHAQTGSNKLQHPVRCRVNHQRSGYKSAASHQRHVYTLDIKEKHPTSELKRGRELGIDGKVKLKKPRRKNVNTIDRKKRNGRSIISLSRGHKERKDNKHSRERKEREYKQTKLKITQFMSPKAIGLKRIKSSAVLKNQAFSKLRH